MGIECVVYMGEIDISRQAPNEKLMKMPMPKSDRNIWKQNLEKDATMTMGDWTKNPIDTHEKGSVVTHLP